MNTYDETDFKSRLLDEYKILQDKIDKIGAFRFTIKGWSVTAVIAAPLATSSKGLATTLIISVGLVLMLIFFFLLEYEQVMLSRLFGNRAGRLEDAFRGISRGKGEQVQRALPVPYTAHELVLSGRHKRSPDRGPDDRQAADKWRAIRQAHFGFYL